MENKIKQLSLTIPKNHSHPSGLLGPVTIQHTEIKQINTE